MKYSHRKGFIDRESYVSQYLALALFVTNDDIDFPDSLATEIVVSTSGFSFAYLKEALSVTCTFPRCSTP